MTLLSLHSTITQHLLNEYHPQEAKMLAYMLCQYFCGKTHSQVLLSWQQNVEPHAIENINDAIQKLLAHTPIQYIIGYTDFCGCTIKVNPDVFIPRPETEELVEWIAHSAKSHIHPNILDICTGSGCIAIALAKILPHANISAWDISAKAISTAHHNATINNVNIHWQQKNILTATNTDTLYDIIASNPPYICRGEESSMPTNVLCEPYQALFVPDSDPLLFYKHISDFAVMHLMPHGLLYFEINERFGEDIKKLLKSKGFTNIILRKDIYGKDRMTCCTMQQPNNH